MTRVLAGAVLLAAAVVLGTVFLWPAPQSGPEPILHGRDVCAQCRMHVSQPGFAAEMRDADGVLSKYDDIGCLLRAMLRSRREIPQAWVEDHAQGDLVPLLAAHLVRTAARNTPMGSGLIAFREESAARAFVATGAGEAVRLENLVHGSGEERG